MKAISLWQPWATLVMNGAKQIETRGRNCTYRGEFAVHAAKHWTYEQRDLCLTEPFFSILRDAGYITRSRSGLHVVDLPVGRILGMATLADTKPTEQLHTISDQERAFGNYAPGRHGYLLRDNRPLRRPIACGGRQAVPFDVPSNVEAKIREQLGGAA